MRVKATTLPALGFAVLTLVMASAQPSATHAAVEADGAQAASSSSDRPAAKADKPRTVNFQLTAPAPAAVPLTLSLREPGGPGAGFAPREIGSTEAQIEAGFSLSPAASFGDARLLDASRYYEGKGPVTWRSNAFDVGKPGGPVDSVRVSVASVAPRAAFSPLSLVRPDGMAFDARKIDVTLTRGWPSAVKLEAGKYALDVSPHAGFGLGGAGGSAEAGATVRLGKNIEDRVTDSLGLRDGSEAFGQRGRWYVFAAASGRAVGLNMLRGQEGDWSRAGLTSDVSSKLIGDAQAGVAWRKGPMQASVGYIHREIKAKNVIMGMATQEDSLVALSFSLKPHW